MSTLSFSLAFLLPVVAAAEQPAPSVGADQSLAPGPAPAQPVQPPAGPAEAPASGGAGPTTRASSVGPSAAAVPGTAPPEALRPSPSSATAAAQPIAASPETSPSIGKGFFVLELESGGLAGALGGMLGLGGGTRQVQAGVAFDVMHTSLSETQSGSDQNDELTTTALSVGPWFRWAIGHALDGRLEAIGTLDFLYMHQSGTFHSGTTINGDSGAANGFVVRAGPGLRFWVTPWLSLAYATQFSFTHLSGPLVALSPTSTIGPPTYTFDDNEVALVGRFAIMALF